MQKKTAFFVLCLLTCSLNVLASSNTFAGFQRHEPNTPPANWDNAKYDPVRGRDVAYFRDDGVGAIHYIYNATAGETWTVEVLQPNMDGSPGGDLKWESSANFPGANIQFDQRIGQPDDVALHDKLCRYGPTPIAVKGGRHYVVATVIANEGLPSQTIEVLDPDGGVPTTLAQKYNNTYTGNRSYKGPESVWTSNNGIEIRVYSPAELLITDPQGRRLGYDRTTGGVFTEIPEGTYDLEPELTLDPNFVDPDPTKVIFINHAINGRYTLEVIGTGNGTYNLEFIMYDTQTHDLPGGRKVLRYIPIASGEVHTYTFNYNSAPGSVITIQGGPPVPGVNNPPVANAGADQYAECMGGSADVALDGSASSDPDGDALTYTWSGPFGTATGPNPTVTLPLGTHTITLTVDDGRGGVASDTVNVTVQDTIPPVVNAGADVTIQATSATGAPFTLTPTVSDACCAVNVVISPQMAEYPIGTTAITVTATDCAGNASSDIMLLTVQSGITPSPPPPPPGMGGDDDDGHDGKSDDEKERAEEKRCKENDLTSVEEWNCYARKEKKKHMHGHHEDHGMEEVTLD